MEDEEKTRKQLLTELASLRLKNDQLQDAPKKAEDELLSGHDDLLEHKDDERGSTLMEINKQLQQEIKERKKREREMLEQDEALQLKSAELKEVNAALKVLLKRTESDKSEIEQKIFYNVKELVISYVEKLKSTRLDDIQLTYVSIIESNLNNILTPFGKMLSDKFAGLTPSEIHIVSLLKEGRKSKEIAAVLGLSPRTVSFHRKNIRKKLGIYNRKKNLRSMLITLR